ncbi:MAG: hypothetical protein ACR2J9_08540, partial [Gaiellales bacterium]
VPYDGEQQSAATESGQPGELNVSAIVYLTAGEGVALVARQTSGGDLDVLGMGQRTSLSLQFLSP